MFKSIALAIQHYARITPDKIAIIANEEKCDYEKLATANRKVAALLASKGVKPGERVLVESDHTVPYVCVEYGIELLNAIFVPLEKGTPTKRILRIAEELNTDIIITLNRREDLPDGWALDEIYAELNSQEDCHEIAEPDKDAIAEILFTTGTTGKSKGVMVSFENQINIANAGVETIKIKQDNIWLIPTPMNHAAALRKVHISMIIGSTSCLLDGFRNIKQFFKTIDDYNVTSIYLPPSAIHMMLALASKNLAALNGKIRFIYSSSTAYPEADKDKMRKLMPDTYMYNIFGSSEVGVICADEFCVSGGSKYSSSIGKPNSYSQIMLLDEEGNEIKNSSAENPGNLCIKSKSVMKGYWNEPELTAQAIKNGNLVMSDLCYFSPEGELILVGRSNDTINLGGFKVAPLEVEELVMKVECVDECILVPMTVGGNAALKLLVVPNKDVEFSEVRIRNIIAEHLEPYKMPKKIQLIEEIIRTFNGKIDRKKMIAEYAI